MASVTIDSLFDESRFPRGIAAIPLMLYTPLGLILVVIRVFIGLQAYLAACILPKVSILRSLVLRTMCGVLGILVTHEGLDNRDKRAKTLVANYTTTLDHLAVDLVLPCILPSVWDLPPLLMWMLGYTDMGAKHGRDKLINNAKKHCQASPIPLLAFPEGASTNGKTGLLKFSVWPFSLDQPIQPVIIKVRRPALVNLAPSVLGGRWWLDIFWFLFVPYTYFHIRLLPCLSSTEDETPDDFARRAQATMATGLRVECTSFTSADKVEYAKRKLMVPHPQADSSTQNASSTPSLGVTRSDDPMVLMTQQVKEVLPYVPLSAIHADLVLTKDVDLTLTNILEGRVAFTPEEISVDPTPSQSTVSSVIHRKSKAQPPASSQDSASPSNVQGFSKVPRDRHMSLEDRKRFLVETARTRYMEKHGMIK